MDGEERRAWWRRKRWFMAASLLMVSYPLSMAPVMYASGRGWVGPAAGSVIERVYAPVLYAVNEAVSAGRSSEYEFEVVTDDGRVVTGNGRADIPWWKAATAVVVSGYWDACVWCGDAGIRHARRAED